MAIRFFFEYNNQVVQLPVNPASLDVAIAGTNKTVDIVELGQVNVLRGIGLAKITVSCFLPETSDAPYILTKGDFRGPQFYLDFFKKVREAQKPVRLIISDTDINMLVSIESVKRGLKAQDDDTHIELSLLEYKNYASKVVTIAKPKDNAKPKATTKPNNRPKTGFAVGNRVKVSGKWWYTSYGASPYGVAPSGFIGKIGIVIADTKRAKRYHIEGLNGGWKGWVDESQLTHA